MFSDGLSNGKVTISIGEAAFEINGQDPRSTIGKPPWVLSTAELEMVDPPSKSLSYNRPPRFSRMPLYIRPI